MNNIFLEIKNTIKDIVSGIMFLPKTIYNFVDQVISDGLSLHVKMKNIAQSNIDLGKYHLGNGNYNDALFRFKLVEKLFDKNSAVVNYHLGFTYFLKENYDKAATYLLKAGSEDQIGLLRFIHNIKTIDIVPINIYKLYRKINAMHFVDKFASETINIPQNLVLELNKVATDLPEQYSILELGSNIGLLGHEIRKRMQDGLVLESTEISRQMINLQDALYPQQHFYNKICNEPVETYLARAEKKYNVIFSLDGFSYIKNLEAIFNNIYTTLNDNGYFAFCVRTTPTSQFTKNLLEFSYDLDQVSANLEVSGFKILSLKNFNLENKNNYTIFVCKK